MIPIGDDDSDLQGGGSQAGGVAYAAHVGGFAAGLLLVKIFAVGHAAT